MLALSRTAAGRGMRDAKDALSKDTKLISSSTFVLHKLSLICNPPLEASGSNWQRWHRRLLTPSYSTNKKSTPFRAYTSQTCTGCNNTSLCWHICGRFRSSCLNLLSGLPFATCWVSSQATLYHLFCIHLVFASPKESHTKPRLLVATSLVLIVCTSPTWLR